MKANAPPRLLLPGLLLLSGCFSTYSPITYVSPTDFFHPGEKYETEKPYRMSDDIVDASLLSEKGQVYVAANTLHGFGGDIAVAVSPKVLVTAGLAVDDRNSSVTDNRSVHFLNADGTVTYWNINYALDNALSSTSGHVAVGLYRALGTSGRNEHVFGVAFGSTDNRYTYRPVDESNYVFRFDFSESRSWIRYYYQENFGFVTPHAEGALVARLSYYRFSRQEFTMDYPQETKEMIPEIFALDPGMKFGFGGKIVHYQVLFNWSFSLAGAEDPKWYPTRLSIGMVARLGAGHAAPPAR